MVDSLPIALLVSTILGFLAGIGVGGGSLLILWLTLIVGMPQDSARIINLCFFLPSAIISTLFRKKDGTVKIRKLFPGLLAGCICAGLVSVFAERFDTELLKKAFGMLLLVTGVRELLYKPKCKDQWERKAK